jgi:hypothetical protein
MLQQCELQFFRHKLSGKKIISSYSNLKKLQALMIRELTRKKNELL